MSTLNNTVTLSMQMRVKCESVRRLTQVLTLLRNGLNGYDDDPILPLIAQVERERDELAVLITGYVSAKLALNDRNNPEV